MDGILKPDDEIHMDVFPWNENFETGNHLIDSQHKKLVSLLNRLAVHLANNREMQIKEAFQELADYSQTHFADEEAYWESRIIDSKLIKAHHEIHRTFAPAVEKMKEEIHGHTNVEIVEKIVKFLIRWFAFHIIDGDKHMSLIADAIDEGASIKEATELAEDKIQHTAQMLVEAILQMYDDLSSSTIHLMRERRARIKAEEELIRVNRGLEELTIKDQLTGLFNRRHFDTALEKEIRRARRNGIPLTYMQLDVDYFKLFNDTYGHSEGDRALEKLGEALNKLCQRPGDCAFRIGGEEFGMILSNLDPLNALSYGEKIIKSIEDLCIPHRTNKASSYMTISAGMICRVPTIDDSEEVFMQAADRKLYEAKEAGRNRILLF